MSSRTLGNELDRWKPLSLKTVKGTRMVLLVHRVAVGQTDSDQFLVACLPTKMWGLQTQATLNPSCSHPLALILKSLLPGISPDHEERPRRWLCCLTDKNSSLVQGIVLSLAPKANGINSEPAPFSLAIWLRNCSLLWGFTYNPYRYLWFSL